MRSLVAAYRVVSVWSLAALISVHLLFLSSQFQSAHAGCSYTSTSGCGLINTETEPDGCSAGCRLESRGYPNCNRCHECGAGTDAPAGNQGHCDACPSGKATQGGGNPCADCDAGTYANGGATVCSPCPSGTYSGATAGSCTACGKGKYANAQNTGCVDCPKGKYGFFTGRSQESQCSTCLAGRYGLTKGLTDWQQCTACGKGKYSEAEGASAESTCVNCGQGKYGLNEGFGSAGQCAFCGKGKYGTNAAATEEAQCAICSKGKHNANEGSISGSACTNCGRGKYGATVGASAASQCTACETGKYLELEGKTAADQCTLCGKGKYNSAEGSQSESACSNCAPGRYLDSTGAHSSEQCIACGQGRYSIATPGTATDQCTACIKGKYNSNEGSSAASSCASCSAGKFGETEAMQSAADCKDCVGGRYSSTQGITELDQCALCGAGKYSTALGGNAESSCIKCSAGRYGLTDGADTSSVCTPCSQGRYNPSEGANTLTACTPCLPGTYNPGSGSATADACNQCTAGKYNENHGSNSSAACIKCPGHQKSGDGAESCSTCPEGQYGRQGECHMCEKGSYCTSGSKAFCPQGTYLDGTGASLRSQCTNCPRGRYFPNDGAVSVDYCIGCLPGKFGDTLGAFSETQCQDCEIGKFAGSVASTTCTPCSTDGMTTTGGSLTSCVACAPGKYLNVSESMKCQVCPPGTLSALGATSCKLCDKGTYGRDGSNLEPRDRCLSCPKGKWGDIEGLVNVSFCQDCSPGKYAASAGLQGDTFCTPCRIGRYLNLSGAYQDDLNTERCNLCERGKLSQFGKTKCEECPRGRYSTSAREYCERCAKGKYSDLVAAYTKSQCKNCAAGRYSGGEGNSRFEDCIECTEGRFSKKTGATRDEDCIKCNAGTFARERGSVNCTICPGGTFSQFNASSDCFGCASGRYSGEGATMCKLCPEGKYSDAQKGALIECKICEAGTYNVFNESGNCRTVEGDHYAEDGYSQQRKCPPGGANCSTGKLHLEPGYFCMANCSKMDETTLFVRCANSKACNNSTFFKLTLYEERRKRRNETSDFFYDYNEGLFVWDEECACGEGYYGKLCQSCSKGYGKATETGITECKKCPSKLTNIMLVAVMMILGIAAVSYIVYRKSKKYKASIVRIGLTFMQFQLYASFVHIEWPIQMRTLFTMQETIASATPSWVSFDCFTIALGIVKPPPERKVCYTNTTDWQRNVSFGQGNATFGQGDATVEQQSIPNVVDVSVSPALAQTRYQVLGIPTLLLGIVFCFFCCRYVYLHLTNGKKGDVVKKNDDGTFDVKFDRDGSRKSNVEVRLIVPIGRSKVVAPGERAIIYKDFEKKWKSNIIRTLMIVEWMIWGQAVKSTLNLVKCTTYDVARLDLDPNIICCQLNDFLMWRCKNDLHFETLLTHVVPSFCLHIIAFPLFMIYVMLHYHSVVVYSDSKETKEEFLASYGFLIAGYREGAHFWELIILLRRILVVFCLVFMERFPQIQVSSIFLTFLMGFYIHILVNPYNLDRKKFGPDIIKRGEIADRLEKLSLMVMMATMLSATFFMAERADENLGEEYAKNLYDLMKNAIGYAIFGANLAFFVYFIHTYTSDKYEKTIKKYAKAAGTAIGDFGQAMSRASISSLGHSPSISSWWGSGTGSEQGDDKQRANSEIRTNVNAMFIRNSGNFAGAVGANGRDRTESGDAVISTMFTNQFYKHQKLAEKKKHGNSQERKGRSAAADDDRLGIELSIMHSGRDSDATLTSRRDGRPRHKRWHSGVTKDGNTYVFNQETGEAWHSYIDEDGNTYAHNSLTDETMWWDQLPLEVRRIFTRVNSGRNRTVTIDERL